MTLALEVGSRYTGRNGYSYLVIATNPLAIAADEAFVGADEATGNVLNWAADGVFSTGNTSPEDLLTLILPDLQLFGFINIYNDDTPNALFADQTSADNAASGNRTAVLDLTNYSIIYTAGTGLS